MKKYFFLIIASIRASYVSLAIAVLFTVVAIIASKEILEGFYGFDFSFLGLDEYKYIMSTSLITTGKGKQPKSTKPKRKNRQIGVVLEEIKGHWTTGYYVFIAFHCIYKPALMRYVNYADFTNLGPNPDYESLKIYLLNIVEEFSQETPPYIPIASLSKTKKILAMVNKQKGSKYLVPWSYIPRKPRFGNFDPRRGLPGITRFTLAQRRIYMYGQPLLAPR